MHTTDDTPVYLPTKEDYDALVDFRRRGISGPPLVYLTVDDTLLVEYYQPQANFTVIVTLRVLTPAGQVVPVAYNYPNASNTVGTAPTQKQISGVEGYLLSATVFSSAQSRGQTFVRLSVRRGYGSQDTANPMVLCQGYATTYEYVCWPNGEIESPLDGRGYMSITVVSAPAAGAEISVPVPAGVNWILRSVSYSLTTSAVVANRLSHLVLDDGANIFWEGVSGSAEAASLTERYSWTAGISAQSDAGNVIQGAIPTECRMRPGWRVRTVTSALDLGDQYSSAIILAEVFTPAN
jgi:hypothetical protein